MALGLYRIIHPKYRVGAIVIARKVIVGGKPAKGHQYYVEVDGVKFKGFSGASFICDIEPEQEQKILDKIIKDVREFESIY